MNRNATRTIKYVPRTFFFIVCSHRTGGLPGTLGTLLTVVTPRALVNRAERGCFLLTVIPSLGRGLVIHIKVLIRI